MKVTNNISVSMTDLTVTGASSRENVRDARNAQDKKQNPGGNIFAGDLKGQFDPIAKKKAMAQKQAMKVVSDAFAGEQKIAEDLENRRTHIRELMAEMGTAKTELQKIQDEMGGLREFYGVEQDSQEQQDLELRLKQAAMMRGEDVTFSKDEQKRLEELITTPMTEYQQRALELDAQGNTYREIIRESENGILEENAIIRGVKLERLKTEPIGEAQKQAEAIMKQANEQIMGMLIEEGKDHMDEESEEIEEKAEEKKAKEQAEEEKLEKIEERKEAMEAQVEGAKEKKEDAPSIDILSGDILTSNILKNDQVKSDIQAEIGTIVDKMKLVAEDIKGAAVDSKL